MPDLLHNESLPYWVAQWTPILLDTALKGMVILTLAALALLFMRCATAALRHLVWLVAVIALLCLPALSVLMPAWNVLPNWFETSALDVQTLSTSSSTDVPATEVSRGNDTLAMARPDDSAQPIVATTDRASAQAVPLAHAQGPLLNSDSPSAEATSVLSTLQLAAACVWVTWAVGALVFSTVTLLGLLSLARLERRSQFVTEKSWRRQTEQLSRELGLHRPVSILLSTQQLMPMVWGLFRVKVLLPEAAAHWDSDRRRFVLLHELAHAKRWDYLTHLLARLACALHWFNPLIWVAAQRMAVERERACDDLVLNSGSEPMDYAEELLNVVAGLRRPTSLGAAAIAMAQPSKLEARLKAILDATICRRRLTRSCMGICLLVAICLVLPLASLRPAATAADNTEIVDNREATTSTMTESSEALPVSIRAEQVQCTGTVVGPAGLPIVRAKVTVYERRFGIAGNITLHQIDEVTTAGDGAFVFTTAPKIQYGVPSECYIVAVKQGMALGWATWKIHANAEFLIQLGEPEAIEGVIADEAGKPVPNAEVRVHLSGPVKRDNGRETKPWLPGISPIRELGTRTDRQGRFKCGNLPADLGVDLLVTAPGRATTYTWQLDLKEPAFMTGQKDIGVILPVEARLAGTIVNYDTNQGLPGIEFALVATSSGLLHYRFVCTTDEKGTFNIGGLQTERYFLRDGGLRNQYVALESGKTAEIELRVKTPYYLRILFEDGNPAIVYRDSSPGTKAKIYLVGAAGRRNVQRVGVVDDQGFAKIYLSQMQLQRLQNRKALFEVSISSSNRKAIVKKEVLGVDLLATDKAKAGVLRLPRPSNSNPGSLAGKPLPELKELIADLKTKQIEGQMVLVCLFDMQQRPSHHYVAQLSQQSKLLKENGIAVVALHASKVEEKMLNGWAKENNIPFPVGQVQGSEGQTRFTWGVRALPWLILTGPDHIVRAEGFSVAELQEKINDPAAKAGAQSRVLRFPKDRSMGTLQMRDAGVHEGLFKGFAEFCEARGDVVVPPGKELILNPSREAARDLSPLTELKTDDLYAIYCWQIPIDDQGLRHVARLSGLKALWLAHTPISDKGMAHLRGLRSLKSLLVMGTEVGDEGMAHLSEMDSLEYLNPRATNVTDHGLAYLSGLKSLKFIDLGYCKITDAGLEHLGKIETLESIDASHSTITDAGLAHLKNLRSLSDLDLQSTNITDAGLEHLSALSLRKVNLRRAKISNSGLAHLAKSRSLEDLRVNSTRITDSGLAHLRSLDSLKYLDIGWTRVTEEGLRHLSGLTSLETLELPRDNGITEQGLSHLAGLERLKKLSGIPGDISTKGLKYLSKMQLESLDLDGAAITDETMSYIVQLRNLRSLDLQKCSTTNAGLAELTKLKSLKSMMLVDSPQITGAGLVHIGKLSSLESVSLHEIYEVGDDDIAHLANLAGLTHFGTDSDRITDSGVAHLSNLRSLTSLSLENARLTDKALSHLAKLKKLEYVHLGGKFTDAGLRRLKGLSLLKSLTLPGAGLSTEALEELEGKLPQLANIEAEGASPLTIGRPLKEFNGIDLDFTPERAKGKMILVCFFDMEQRPSRNCIMQLARQARQLKQEGVAVVTVQASKVDEKKLNEWAKRNDIPFPVGTIQADEKKTRVNWGIRSLPWLVVTNKQHVIQAEGLTPDQLDDVINQHVEKPLAQSRVLHFPRDRSLGMVMTVDRNLLDSTSYDDWEALGEATGDLPIPQGKAVRLDVSREACEDLSPLSALAPDDLHMIFCRRPEFTDDALTHMSHLTGLQELYLRGTGLLGTGLKHLARLRSLKRLRVDGTHVGDRELAYLVDLPALESLNLAWTPTGDAGMKHIGKIVSLRELILGKGIGDEGLSHLKDLVGLRYLLLDGQAITDAGLAHVAGMTQMETLWLDGAQVSDAGLVHLKGMTSIKTLCLYGTQVTEKGLAHLGGLQALEALLLSFPVADTGLQHLAQLQALKGIGIDGDTVTASGLPALTRMKGLEGIGIRSQEDPEAVVKHLAALPRLSRLDLPRGTTDKTMAQLKNLTALQELSLNSEQITSRGLAILTRLPSLQRLSLMDMRLSTEDWGTLGRMSSLQRLDVHIRSEITNAHMARLVGLQSLKHLSIDCSQEVHITDEGLAHLAKLTSLEHLTLHSAKITDQGLQHLKGLSSLKWMDLQGCQVTDQGLERLKQKLPALHWYL